jgi:alkylation response protein AidB-like acyl-CoA dehydrogenase
MALLCEEQNIIRDQARAWVDENTPVNAFRAVRDEGTGFDDATWREMVELGWTGLMVPEAHGGAGLGYMTFGLVLEQLGRNLVASPLLASSLVGVAALLESADAGHAQALLPAVAAGTAIVTLAVDEGPRHAPERTSLCAASDGAGFVLTGGKSAVLEGMAATHFIVPARGDDAAAGLAGVTLFVVPADAPGITRTTMALMDGRGYASLQFDGVKLDSSAVLGDPSRGGAVLRATLDRAAAAQSAEMLGSASRAFEMTLEYLKTRKQFGQVIGGFQALGHRAAELYSAMEISRSCAEAALQALDDGADDADALCALAKAKVGDFLYLVSNELIQIHGGIGMTDEFDAGLYLKRARAQEAAFGNRAFYRNRYAELAGF